jgi:hypothetical protein
VFQSFISQICRGQNPSSEPTEETRRRFDQWLALHQQHVPPGSLPLIAAPPTPTHPSPSMLGHPASMASIPRPTPHFNDHHHRRLPHSPSKMDALSQHPGMPDHMHPALQVKLSLLLVIHL